MSRYNNLIIVAGILALSVSLIAFISQGGLTGNYVNTISYRDSQPAYAKAQPFLKCPHLTTQCSEDTLQLCRAGRWVDYRRCEFGCEDSKCIQSTELQRKSQKRVFDQRFHKGIY